MDNFDYETPYLTVLGIGRIDCRNEIDFQPLAQSYAHTDPAIYEGRDAAIKDFAHGGQTSNPYRQWMRPLKWTAWNLGYAFWMKNLRCPAQTTKEPRGDSGNNRITQEVDKDTLWKEAQKKAGEQSATRSNVTVGLKLTDDDLLSYLQAMSASHSGDYTTAISFYRPLAEQGHAGSQAELARIYDLGQGVPQDYAEAAKWYRKAAEQGGKHAQYDLGRIYDLGQGVQQDYAEAAKWYRKAAEQGHAYAQYNLGRMYGLGQGVQQDHAEAAKWVRKAAEQGHAVAQYNLGIMCAKGKVVPLDYLEAFKWYRKAAEQGQAKAQYDLGRMCALGEGVPLDYELAHKWLSLAATYWDASDEAGRNGVIKQRDHIATLMSPEQIVTAQYLAREWKPTAPP